MKPILLNAGFVLLAYLLGAVPFGLLVARLRGVDIRKVGSGNIGATNVFRSVGKPWGILTFACDLLKGFVPVFCFPRLALAAGIEPFPCLGILCGIGAVVGHNWPIYLGFKGGKGVATSAGLLIGLAPQAVLIGLGLWIVTFLISRYVSVASILAALAIALVGWPLYFASRGPVLPAVLTLLGLLTIWRHRSNIQRLRNGTENRFNFKRKPAA